MNSPEWKDLPIDVLEAMLNDLKGGQNGSQVRKYLEEKKKRGEPFPSELLDNDIQEVHMHFPHYPGGPARVRIVKR